MALKDFRTRADKKAEDTTLTQGMQPEATYIDEGCEVSGDLRFKETVRIDGRVSGEIRAAKTVIVGESAVIEAGIDAESVVVFGSVDGNIRARRKITLHKSANVKAEIQTSGIVVEEGARFKGCIVIGSEDIPHTGAPKTPAPKGQTGGASPPAGKGTGTG